MAYQDVSSHLVNFSDLSRFTQFQDDFRMEIISIAAWLIWNRRNAIHFVQTTHPLTNICSMTGNLLQEYLVAQNDDLVLPCPTIMQQWRSPDHNIYKVNFDAAIFSSSNLAGIGVISCDCDGEAIGALSMPIPLAQLVAAMEALACCGVVKFAIEIGLFQVVFEGDSVVIINALTKDTGELSSYGNILEDICTLVFVFQLVEFNHVPRNCNSVTNAFAKKVSSVLRLQVWLEDIPPDIVPLV
ncbi:uncharacterized protein LOC142629125 [Castanea sativa]|uniref:uncharacterized protein LOC142629125 n=1 Tax=Castanea sativa TaxID=21020 RepID=UPI003F651AA8